MFVVRYGLVFLLVVGGVSQQAPPTGEQFQTADSFHDGFTNSRGEKLSTTVARRKDTVRDEQIAARQLSFTKLTDTDTILLADFTNRTEDEIFNGALDQALRTALDESPFLSVLSGAGVAGTLKDMARPANTSLAPDIALAVCQRTKSKAYVAGSISSRGMEFAVDLKALDCMSGETLVQAQSIAQGKDKVLDALGEAVSKVRVQLGEPPEAVREFSTPLSRATSPSFEALQAWGAAIRAQQEKADLAEGSQAALPLLEKAIKLDPDFASALVAIGLISRDALQESRAREYLTRAFALRERSSMREKFRIAGMYYSFVTVEYEKAVETYQKWIKAYPRDERPVSNLGSFYGDVCRYQEAIAQFLEARRMNPSNVIPHEDLIEILVATGQFEKAHEAYREMVRMKLDDDSPHVFMYAVAALEHDPKEMAEQAAWFEGKPQLQHEVLSEEADAEAYTGHFARARALTSQAVESALRADNKEQAAAWQLNSAWREEVFGNTREAREQAIRALELAPDSREEGAVAAILLARTGDTVRAQVIAKDLEQRYPVHAVVQSYWLPCIRAQLSLASKRPASALRLLEKAKPYDTLFPQVAFYSPMLSVVLRAEAYLALGQPAAAVREFSKISQYPGIVQLSATAPISKLQLARASALQARTNNSARTEARTAYQDFLSLWKDADPNIPLLKEAKAELANLK
jgi:eukaryotic-like serine/threonine-protein kinase